MCRRRGPSYCILKLLALSVLAITLSGADARQRRAMQEDDRSSERAPFAQIPSYLKETHMRYSKLGPADKGQGPLIFIGVFTDFPEPSDCGAGAFSVTADEDDDNSDGADDDDDLNDGTAAANGAADDDASSPASVSSRHARRRAAARTSWMHDAASLPRVAVRFVTREPHGPVGRSQLKAELREHGDIWVMPAAGDVDEDVAKSEQRRRQRRRGGSRMVHGTIGGGAAAGAAAAAAGAAAVGTAEALAEEVRCTGNQPLTVSGVVTPDVMRRFLAKVAREHASVEYIVYLDDSALLLPERLLCAADQWAAIGADYVGCMAYDKVPQDDPLAYFLSTHYPLHAAGGSAAVLSAAAVRDVVVLGYDTLRLEGRADVAVGLWMLTSNVTYFDDRRLCHVSPGGRCGPAAVGLYGSSKGGGSGTGGGGLAVEQVLSLYSHASCRSTPACPLPYLRSKLKSVEEYMAPMRV